MSVLRPSVDAYVLQASPAANRPDTPKLQLSGTASAIKRSYLFFGRPFPYGASILTATLRLTLASAWTGQTLTIRRVTGEWRERTISYNAEPTNTTTNEVSQAITGSAGDAVEIDISPLLDDVSAGGAWHGLRLAISASVDRSFYSSDSATASERPEVDIEWADLPDAPSEMTPSGGMAVSDSKPVLSWRFATQGNEADQEQALSQVQISTSTSFATPEYDSTMTANTQTSWDLAATAYGGLTDGATRYWRVRVQDQAGLTSEWSETQQFVRDAKPTLTISSPTTTTEDTTPPIAWDLDSPLRKVLLSLGPSLYWPLDAKYGATDQSGNARNGTAVGGVTIGGFADGPLAGTDTSTDFDGTDDRITSTYNPFVNATVRTYSGWAWRDTSSSVDVLLAADVASSVQIKLLSGVNTLEFVASSIATQWVSWPGNAQWVHWAIVFDEAANTAALYINGALVSSQAKTDAYAASPGNIEVGARVGTVDPFDGKQAHVAVFERGLTAAEISDLYDASLEVVVQESWALWLHELTADGPKELLHVPRNVSTVEEYTIPPGSGYGSTQRSYIKTGRTYRVTVRAWDGADRAATPGDPPYVEATQEFTYVRSGTPDPVTTLTATADGPKVALVWSRANRPDFFSLRVDGEEVLTRIDPEEVSTGGTGYAMDWWGATGGVAHTYEIEAVVLTAGKYLHSDGNATASATTRVIGFWLVDPDDSTAVQITGPDDDVDLQIREVGTTFDIIGSRTPVRIVDAVMGYSGSVQGHVGSIAERDDFLDLKGRLKPLRFIVADLNLEVLLEEVSCAPHRSPAGLYRASAQFFQTDDFTFELAGEATAIASGSEVIDTEGALL